MEQATPIQELPFNKKKLQQEQTPQNVPPNPMAAAGEGPPQPVNTSADAAARFAQMPNPGALQVPPGGGPPGIAQVPEEQRAMLQQPVIDSQGAIPQPNGPGQGMSAPLKPGTLKKKEFFGLAETDYKSTVVVFALILIFSSSIFFDLLKRYIPLVQSDGKNTIIGSLIGAILGAIIFLLIKVLAKI